MENEAYKKILVARHSPKNGCNAEDGDVLIIVPRRTIPQRTTVSHYFIAAKDGKTKSKYGWVQDVSAFTLDDFVKSYLAAGKMSDTEREHIETMLVSIQKLPENTPTTATYRVRGAIERRMKLTVHRVVFYRN